MHRSIVEDRRRGPLNPTAPDNSLMVKTVQTPKVLLVSDDQASLSALEGLLMGSAQRLAYDIHAAGSGKDALRQVLTHDFALILLDANLTGMDGFETAAAIHSHPRSCAVPLILVTSQHADEVTRLRAYQCGAVDYLFAPVVPQVLQAKVAVFVELARKQLQLGVRGDELLDLNKALRAQRLQDLERLDRQLADEATMRKQTEQRAQDLATRDPLTGLLNRRTLIVQIEHAVACADRKQGQFALLLFNLRRFKQVNDAHGLATGDELLRQVAARLYASVRACDTVARLGADEFVLLIEGGDADANAARVAAKIARANALPYDIGIHHLRLESWIGVALYPRDGGSAGALLRSADLALQQARLTADGARAIACGTRTK